MKTIIAGGRDFNDFEHLSYSIDSILSTNPVTEVVCGLARGADTLGEKWAIENNIQVAYFPADWEKYGKSAGFIRNKEMADYADQLIAFWDRKSKGTKHMIDLAIKNRLTVNIFYY